MRKLLLLLVFLPIFLSAQNELDLLPTNMQNYLGKVNREQFEKIAGKSVDTEMNAYVYNVLNTYDNGETAIRCIYRESDGKLISVKFGTRYFLAYCIDFGGAGTKEYPGVKGYTINSGKWIKNSYGDPIKIEYNVSGFGMQILDITIVSRDRQGRIMETTAIINYHI